MDEPSIQSIHQHFRGLRDNVMYAECLKVVFIEANLESKWCDRIRTLLEESYGPIMVIGRDKPDGQPGVWTTNTSKHAGVIYLQDALVEDSIRFADPMYFVSQDRTKELAAICDQIRDYRKHVAQPIDLVFGKSKARFSGKAPGRQDDYAMCVTQVLVLAGTQRRDKIFIETLRKMGKAA